MLDRLSLLIGRVSTLSLEDLKREDGQTTVEYAVVLVLVILLATAVFAALKGSVVSAMSTIGNQITDLVPVSLP
jgi:Flp pilus assembly pilin Flp